VGRKRRILTDEEILRRHTLLLKQMGEAAGLSQEEMEMRWNELIRRSTEGLELATEQTSSVQSKRIEKRRPVMKVTLSLKDTEVPMFESLKKKFNSKSNAEVFRRLLIEAYRGLSQESLAS